MPSMGSTTQVMPLVPGRPPSSSPRTASSGRSSASRREDELLAALVHLGDRVGLASTSSDDPERRRGARRRRGGRRRARPGRRRPRARRRRGLSGSRSSGAWRPSVAAAQGGLRRAQVGAAAGRAHRGPDVTGQPGLGDDDLAARLGGPLEEEVDEPLDEQRRRCRASPPGRTAPRPARPSRRPRCRGRGRPPCGRTRSRWARRRRVRVGSAAASSSIRSLTSGSSHGWFGGPEREQKTSSPVTSRPSASLTSSVSRPGQADVLVGVEVALAVAGAGRVVHRLGDRVGDVEDARARSRSGRSAIDVEEGAPPRRAEAGVHGVGTDLVDDEAVGGRADLGDGGREVLAVLPARGVAGVGAREERDDPGGAEVEGLVDRVGEVRLAVAVAPDDGDVEAAAGQLGAQPLEQGAVEVVDRAAPTAGEVVLGDDGEALVGDAPARR